MDFSWLKNLLSVKKPEANQPAPNKVSRASGFAGARRGVWGHLRPESHDANSNKRAERAPNKNVEEVCVFPLPNVVLIPGNVLPLHIFEERYKQMTDELLRTNLPLAMSLVRTGPEGAVKNSVICGGGGVKIIDEFPDGRKNIFVEGLKRLRIVKYLQESPYMKAMAETIPDIPFVSQTEEKKYLEELAHLSKRWIFLSRDLPDAYIPYVDLFIRPHLLADFIGFHFLPSSEEKQRLLETTDQKKRVEKILLFVGGNVRRLEGIGPKGMENLKGSERILH